MTGLMMDYPLKVYPGREIASRRDDDTMHRYTCADFHCRAHRLAHVLDALGLQPGERVGSLCWNGYRHLELYFAGPAPAA
ncbi:MAG TPA: AMP-binding protein [Bryobacteraceae bacterium]|nr:AMP-binding protein [Bryobacteraceae bacterium]